MTDQTNHMDAILARYQSGPALLKDAVNHLTETQLDLTPTAASWSIRQIAHHIVDGDDMWRVAIKAALGNSQAVLGFSWYWDKPQDEWAKCWNYVGRALEPSLILFSANRRYVEQLISQIPDAWNRSIWIKWPTKQEQITVGAIVEMQARHAIHHIDDILAIRREHGL